MKAQNVTMKRSSLSYMLIVKLNQRLFFQTRIYCMEMFDQTSELYVLTEFRSFNEGEKSFP